MNNLRHLITILLFLLSIHYLQAQCPAQLELKGVQHGLFVLDNLTPTDRNAHTDVIAFRQYSVLLKNPLSNPKILLALASISTLTSTIDLFDINIIAKTQTQFVLGFIYEPLKWKKISYKYLINNRTDLNFHMVTLSSVSFKTSNNSIIAETELETELKNFQNYQVLSFIRGLKYKNNDLVNHSLAVSIVSGKLSSKTIAFNISAVTNSNKIELQLLSVSYLYFDSKQETFASFGGLISRSNYVGNNQIDILHADLPTDLYWLYGITNIDFSGNNFSVTSEITEELFFELETSLTAKKIEFTYFSIARKASQVCSNCPNNILSGTLCVKDCLPNQIYYIFKDGQKACQKCAGNLFADKQRKNCVTGTSEKALKNISTQNNVQYQQSQEYNPVNPNQNDQAQSKNSIIQKNSNSSVQKTSPSGVVQTKQIIQTKPQLNLPLSPENIVTPRAIIEQFNYCNMLGNLYWTGQSCQCRVGFKRILGSCVSLILIEQSQNPQMADQTVPSVSANPVTTKVEDNSAQKNLSQIKTSGAKSEPLETQQTEKRIRDVLNEVTDQSQTAQTTQTKADSSDTQNGSTEAATQTSTQTDTSVSSSQLTTSSPAATTIPNLSTPTKPQPSTSAPSSAPVPAQPSIQTPILNPVTPLKPTPAPAPVPAPKPAPAPVPAPKPVPSPVTVPVPVPVQPSIQTPVLNPVPAPKPTPAPVTVPAAQVPLVDCMKLAKTPQINAANIYVSLELTNEMNFRSEDEMQNFLKQDFEQDFSKPSSVYCLQSDESLKEFDCLLLYPTGVPNSSFEIRFWYNDSTSGSQCSLKVPVNPLDVSAKSLRSLRRRL